VATYIYEIVFNAKCNCMHIVSFITWTVRDAANITHVAHLVLIPTMHCNTMSTTAAAH